MHPFVVAFSKTTRLPCKRLTDFRPIPWDYFTHKTLPFPQFSHGITDGIEAYCVETGSFSPGCVVYHVTLASLEQIKPSKDGPKEKLSKPTTPKTKPKSYVDLSDF